MTNKLQNRGLFGVVGLELVYMLYKVAGDRRTTIIQATSQTCVPTSNSGEDDSEPDIVGSAVISSGIVAPEMGELDINTRDRLGVARIEMGDIGEGCVWLPRPHSNSLLIIMQDARELHLA